MWAIRCSLVCLRTFVQHYVEKHLRCTLTYLRFAQRLVDGHSRVYLDVPTLLRPTLGRWKSQSWNDNLSMLHSSQHAVYHLFTRESRLPRPACLSGRPSPADWLILFRLVVQRTLPWHLLGVTPRLSKSETLAASPQICSGIKSLYWSCICLEFSHTSHSFKSTLYILCTFYHAHYFIWANANFLDFHCYFHQTQSSVLVSSWWNSCSINVCGALEYIFLEEGNSFHAFLACSSPRGNKIWFHHYASNWWFFCTVYFLLVEVLWRQTMRFESACIS